MKKQRLLFLIIIIVIVAICFRLGVGKTGTSITEFTEVDYSAPITPDYEGIVVPPNISPMNFRVLAEGDKVFVKISCPSAPSSGSIDIAADTGLIRIPANQWKKLLDNSRGKEIAFDVYVKGGDNGWKKYKRIVNRVAGEDIDPYLVYRFMKPIYNNWNNIEIRQRDLTGFHDTVVLSGKSFAHGCLNCHSFAANDPRVMTIGIRSEKFGSATLLARDGKVERIGTKWGYTSWHPSGKIAAFSLNKVRQFFHTTAFEDRDVVDLDSAIAYYVVNSRQTKTTPALSDKAKLETYPNWSPDGKYLYFCSADMLWTDRDKMPPERYDEVRYDLKRISYDIDTDKWGQAETVLSAAETGQSILLPKVSPDGKFLAFCMCDYGCFPIFRPSSDLYLMNLESGKYHKFAHSSEYSESWHSFSSNSRWLVFSSKQRDGQFTRTYICYIDETGKEHKPFIMPIKNPDHYESQLRTYSLPELVTAPVKHRIPLARAARSSEQIEVKLPITSATSKSSQSEPWRQSHE